MLLSPVSGLSSPALGRNPELPLDVLDSGADDLDLVKAIGAQCRSLGGSAGAK
jgi:hypothetical protein